MRLLAGRRAARVERELTRLGPWYTRFDVDGRTYGGHVSLEEDWRVAQFDGSLGDARRILELGSFEGGMTFHLARRPGSQVVAVEGREENVRRARYMQRLLHAGNIRFVVADLETTPLASFGTDFDTVLCSGLLYHLPRPALLVDQLRAVAPRAFIWTHYAAPDRVEAEVDGMPGHWYAELGRRDPLSGLSERSFWVTLPALVDRVRAAGFDDVEIVQDDPTGHPNGPCVSIVARAHAGR